MRAMLGFSENTDGDMGLLIRNVDRLRFELDCTVVLVHHSGHKDESRGRGHSSLPAAIDDSFKIT